jgi:protein-S-isoprenylcysteine O-methyltransferase Ste14
MRALLSVLYALAAYLAFSATLLWFIGFSANLLVPKSVDVGGAGAAWPAALVDDALLIVLFGVQHSAMARRGFKQWWTRIVPEIVERSTYVVASSLVLAAVMAFWQPIAAPVAWRVEGPAAGVLWAVFGIGWAIVAISTFLLDHFELFGLRQAFSALVGRPAPAMELRTPLFYRHVRHPLYLGFLVTFWSVPVMTAGHLLFSLGMSAYILVGIAFEERDLVRQFGERYHAYRRQAGMLLPRLRASDPDRREGTSGNRLR